MRTKYEIRTLGTAEKEERMVLDTITGRNAKRRAYRTCKTMVKAGKRVQVIIFRFTKIGGWFYAGGTSYDASNDLFIEHLQQPNNDALGPVPTHLSELSILR